MSFWSNSFIYRELSKKTSIFGLRLWLVICIVAGATIVLFLFLLTICCTSCRRRRRRRRRIPQQKIAPKQQQLKPQLPQPPTLAPPPPSKEIHQHRQQLQQHNLAEVQIEIGKHEHGDGPRAYHHHRRQPPPPQPAEVQIKIEKHEHSDGPRHHGGVSPEVPHLGWGHCYTMRELEEATGDFAEENVIGEGGYGVVYRGVLADNTVIAVKKLLDNRGQAEKEFRVEVEAIGRVRHKHLVSLLGYCAEGELRMLVYEYVDNGNLEQWLYGDVGEVSPLTWEIRMNILLGTAKGLAYLHEGLEPKVVHRDVKASNILIDQQWNSKISDFGLAKLLGPERTHVTTRVMGTFGYVAPEYASTGMLNERSDVYSFGVLIMEVITGRTPVDYRRPKGEVHLVEWLKTMIGDRRSEEVADPKLREKPSSKALKRALLVALQCVDPDSKMRPKMGSVIHMLEMDDSLIRNDLKVGRQSPSFQRDYNITEERRFQKYEVSSTSR